MQVSVFKRFCSSNAPEESHVIAMRESQHTLEHALGGAADPSFQPLFLLDVECASKPEMRQGIAVQLHGCNTNCDAM